MAKLGINLKDGDGNFLYPRTFVEMIVRHSSNESLATILGNLSKDVVQAKADVDTFLSDFSLSKEVRTALIELRDYLESDDGKITEQLLSTINDLKDNAVKCPDYNNGEYIGTLTHGGTVLYPFTRDDLVFINSIPDYASLDSLLPRILTRDAQTLSLEDKQQARTNVGAVGVKYTDNRGAHLEQAGTEIMPYTKAEYVAYRGSNLDTVVNVLDERSSETKEKVDTFLADADTSEQALDKLKELQDYIKNDETSASQMLGDIAQNKNDIADNAEALEKEATRAKQVEMYLESQKANKYGYYENLSVGVSDNLSGRGEATESEFTMRPSGGENKSIEDGTTRINSIKGNSVVWNQLVNGFNRVVDKQLTDNFDYEITSDEIILTCHTGGASKNTYLFGLSFGANISVNDKVYASIECKSSFDCSIRVFPAYNAVGVFKPNSVYTKYSFVGTINKTSSQSNILYILFNTLDGLSLNVGDEIRFKKPQFTNLTKMFNGVNEPTTVEEFELLYGNMPNEYNEGTIIDNHTTAIKSVGVNAWDEEWKVGALDIDNGTDISNNNTIRTKNFIPVIGGQTYYFGSTREGIENFYLRVACYDANKNFVGNIRYGVYPGTSINTSNYNNPCTFDTNVAYIRFDVSPEYGTTYNHDICIHLVHTGYLNGKYFPYESQTRELPTVEGGLKSAGTAYDEIRYNKGKDKWEHVQRIGQVGLGELDWGISSTVTDGIVRFYSSEIAGAVPVSNVDEIGNIICDKYLSVNAGNTWDLIKGVSMNTVPRLFIYDSAYTDVATFKAAMQGVILYYELAKPVVTELDVDISPDYKVWDYGTEEAISEVLSTPVRINANYGFNAVGQITDNTELIKELLARVAVLEAQVAQANVEQIEPIVE